MDINGYFGDYLLGRALQIAPILLDELAEEGILTEHTGAACHKHLASGTGQGHVQFAVDQMAVLHKRVGGKEVQLVLAGDGEAVDDDIALRALIALHGVDADVEQFGYA